MTREELIEKARIAYVEAWEAEDTRIENWDRDARGQGNRSRAGIRAALAVFEQAHCPAGDARGVAAQDIPEAQFVSSTNFRRTAQSVSRHHIVACAKCGQRPVVAFDERNSDIVICDRCAYEEGREVAPSELAKAFRDAARRNRESDRGFLLRPAMFADWLDKEAHRVERHGQSFDS